MKRLIATLVFATAFTTILKSQNKQIIYGFDQIPQSLLLNPGAKLNYKYTVGIPFLSGISISAGLKGLSVSQIFRADKNNITAKLLNALNSLTNDDYFQAYVQTEILSGTYKLDKNNYLSAGFYTEIDVFAKIPKDILLLLSQGNIAFLNKSFFLSQLNFRADALGVLHLGLSRKISEKLNIGTRLKLYSGIANIGSTNNLGSFSTRLGQNNIYTNNLNNVNISAYSSGIYDKNDQAVPISKLAKRSFLGGNLGFGFDLGLTYTIDKQTELTASLLDIGFISYTKDVRNSETIGSYEFSGIEFDFTGTNINYLQELNDDFSEKVPTRENRKSYSVVRPVKLNVSIKRLWGKSREIKNCHDISYNKYFNNAIGVQLFTVARPDGPKMAFTGFYERMLFKGLNSKLGYTIDDFSYSNISAGLSAKVGKFHLYAGLTNVLKLLDIASAKTASFELGFNLLFK
ncbi:MAG: DUF5723 family protein [Tenacibaculum sp.]